MRAIEDVNASMKPSVEMKVEGQTKQKQQRKIIGYRAKKDPLTGAYSTYPVYEDEKK